MQVEISIGSFRSHAFENLCRSSVPNERIVGFSMWEARVGDMFMRELPAPKGTRSAAAVSMG